jgi:CPA2 family monovalent cation:H+ antiporter-2
MHNLDLILTLTGGLSAALLFGYLSQRSGLSPIVGYLFAGIALSVLSKMTPSFVADEGLAKQMAEIGVILLMFGVGLHFHFKELLAVKGIAIPGAIVQSAVATLLSMVLMRLFGWSWTEGAVFGMAIAVASTVVLTRILVDNNDLHTTTGHIAIGWLVVEDIFTVFVLVLIPAVFGGGAAGGGALTMALIMTTLKIGALVLFTFVVGWMIPRILTMIARTRSRELFTLAILVLALGIAVGAAKVFGVSMELGAFLAGMVVGRSEFSTRAATDALPMKDAFAVLFFVSVGMLFDFHALLEAPGLVMATIGIVVIGKPLAAIVITLALSYPLKTAFSVGAVLSQIGEFSFIVGTMGMQYGLVSEEAFNVLVATAIVSITISPLLYRFAGPLEQWAVSIPAVRQRFAKPPGRRHDAHAPAHVHDAQRRAIIVGYGPVGQTVVRLLQENDVVPIVIELNVDTVRHLMKANIGVIFGDATHTEALEVAGTANADFLILSSSSTPQGREIIQEARRLNPAIRVLARTTYLREAQELREAGAGAVFSGEGEVALSITEHILDTFGATREQIDRERDRVRKEFFHGPVKAAATEIPTTP